MASKQGLNGEEVVVSGISGIFPKSDSLQELNENLYNKVNMVSLNHSLENSKIPELPIHTGNISGLKKFDAQFFRVSYWQVIDIDPLSRKLMEHTFNAIFDAGINPTTLAGKKVGVYVGASFNDHFAKMMNTFNNKNIFVPVGVSLALMANRISYWLDSKHPSYTVDYSCVSSSLCLEKAVNDIRCGIVDAAIVGSTNGCSNPILSYNLRKAGLLCLDGKTKCFNKDGDGYVRSEAVNSIFLQRAKDAKRVYAEICHIKGQYHMRRNADFLPIREANDLEIFLNTFYKESKVSPKDVEYIEANGAGIAQADENEIIAIDRVFCTEKQLLVGSIKSNMGHTEAASGICSLTKLCLAYHSGKLPANLHYEHPLDTEAICEGSVRVLTENTKFNRGYTAINNFSFTGGNYHTLMKGHYKPKDKNRYRTNIPYLVVASGREENSVNKIISLLNNNPIDAEQIGLLHNIYRDNIPGHTGRGFTILDTDGENKTINVGHGFEYYPGEPRQVWFVYSGMGSQWLGMGTELMKIPMFAESIYKLQAVLKPKNVDIINIITSHEKNIFDNILNSFVGISAVQIALTDILRELGIVPDYFIGHSLGEHACAYADGCLTAEEMILSSYYRGVLSIETDFIHGSMAAVGLGYNKIKDMCPPEIEVACRNSSGSSTITGPTKDVEEFVNRLINQNIFAKEVNTNNIAYHSRYVAKGGSKFLRMLNDLKLQPRKRSSQWLCTSEPEEKWNVAEYCTDVYFMNNFLNPVYFEETARKIPENSIVIEIAPHGLLQAIITRSHPNCTHIPLTRKEHSNPVAFLLEAIGKLYQSGLNPKVDVLYPKIEFPVSTETPLLSHLIEWEHSEEWPTDNYIDIKHIVSASRTVDVSADDENYLYLKEYTKNDVNVFPEAAILVLVWETLAMYMNMEYHEVSVIFKEIRFENVIKIKPNEDIKLDISIQKGSQRFEVTKENILAVSGYIHKINSRNKRNFGQENKKPNIEGENICLNSDEVYRAFQVKGYAFNDEFQTIISMKPQSHHAIIKWRANWTTFLDGIFQLNAFVRDHDGVSSIKFINRLRIDVLVHANEIMVTDKDVCYNAFANEEMGTNVTCGGVTIESIIFSDSPNIFSQSSLLESTDTKQNSNKYSNETQKLVFSEEVNYKELKYIKSKPMLSNKYVQISFYGLPVKGDINLDQTAESYIDFSGIDKQGQRVMGVSKSRFFSSTLSEDLDFIWPVPDHWSLEDAATVPLPYLHVYYCLVIRSQVMKGFTVLVTNGASALGQAAISLCLSLDCNLFATVNNNNEKRLLIKSYPTLDEKSLVFNSEIEKAGPSAFGVIMERCQIVINSCSGDLRKACLKLVSPYGMFLDLSEKDKKENHDFGMYYLFECKNYVSVQISNLMKPENIAERKKLISVIADGIAKGNVNPLIRMVYPYDEVSRPSEFLLTHKDQSRILINLGSKTIFDRTVLPSAHVITESVIFIFCDDAEILTGFVDHLIHNGAKKFVLHLNGESITEYIKWKILKWENKNITIKVQSDKLYTQEAVQNFISIGLEIGNIGDIYILNHLKEINNNNEGNTIVNILSVLQNIDGVLRIIPNISSRLIVVIVSAKHANLPINKLKENANAHNREGLHTLFIHILRFQELKQVYYRLNHGLFQELFMAVNSGFRSKSSFITIDHSTHAPNSEVFPNNQTCLENINNANHKIGLGALFSVMKADNFLHKENIIKMKTMTSAPYENEINPNTTHLILIPGFGGHQNTFEEIAVKLKIAAVALELNPYGNYDSIQKIAIEQYKILKSKLKTLSKFYILGYSFGVNIALELAALMEKEGHIGVIFCLDSSPSAVRTHLDYHLGSLTETELQNTIIEYVYTSITGQDSVDLNGTLQDANNMKEKIEKCLLRLGGLMNYTNEYVASIIQSLYKRIVLAKDYIPKIKLESELVLIQGLPHCEVKVLDDDYGLAEYCSKPVKIVNINSDHTGAPYDCNVTNIVNQTLDPELLKEFKKHKTCDTYLMI